MENQPPPPPTEIHQSAGPLHTDSELQGATLLDQKPRIAGDLLAENMKSLDWERVEALVPQKARGRITTAAVGYASLALVAVDSLASHLPQEAASHTSERATIAAGQVKEVRPKLGMASKAIGFFSPGLANRFDGFVARKAQERIDRTTGHVAAFIEAMGSAESPKDAFVAEVAKIYDFVRNDKYERKPDEILANLLWDAGDAWSNRPTGSYGRWLQENCPLIANSVSIFMNPALGAKLRHPRMVRAIAPEIVEGLKQFLEEHSEQRVPHVQVDAQDSVLRSIGQRYRSRDMAALPGRISRALTQVHEVLPQNGPQFRQEITHVVREAAVIRDPQQLIGALVRLQDVHNHMREEDRDKERD